MLNQLFRLLCLPIILLATWGEASAGLAGSDPTIAKIKNVVVIVLENHSFDNLYGLFPGANGLQNVTPMNSTQLDRDGSVLNELPPIWGGLTAEGVVPVINQIQTEHLPNKPFAVDDPKKLNASLSVMTRNVTNNFYSNKMQINGGKNNYFAAYGKSGALVMSYYDGSKLPLWPLAKKYTLADNFFSGAFGNSFLNHFWLICACTPFYPNANKSPAKGLIAVLDADMVTPTLTADSPKSAMGGESIFVNIGKITPDFYAVDTLYPAYQPSKYESAKGGNPSYADTKNSNVLPPQTDKTIGEMLSKKNVSWSWYGGAWQMFLDGDRTDPVPNFKSHHQPFNYFSAYAPGTKARALHLVDGGLKGEVFMKAIDAGMLPQVSFYKPQGNLNQHSGYTDILSGDEHIADVISHLEKSPQWSNMLVIVTYDESGGYWDHVAPPKGDRWGPGLRIPTLLISPLVKKGFVDHTQYDSTSIMRFINKRFQLQPLPGLQARDKALKTNGMPPIGDLTNALIDGAAR